MVVDKIISLSESVVLVSFGHEISLQLHEQVMQAKQLIESNLFEGFVETVPAYNSMAVHYNPLQISRTELTIAATVIKQVEQILSNNHITIQPFYASPLITIPVCYDQEFGIDLEELAATLQLTVTEIIQLHVSKTYKVYMTGFIPGFPYMGILDEQLVTKRRSSPRVKVEAGSVAIAGNQTGIYTFNTPGGWNIIGKTPLKLFNSSKPNSFVLKAGDEVKFVPISKEQFYKTPSAVESPDGGLLQKELIHQTKTADEHSQLIHIEKCGFLSTIQDKGRKGYLQHGVAKGGAMDHYSMQLANLLTGNDVNAPVLEITQSPHQFHFLADALVAFTGGGLQPVVNEKELPLFQCLLIPKGSIIELKKQIPGFRLYMAVAGGVEAEPFLNSFSTNLYVRAGGYKGMPLKKGDVLHQQQPITSYQKNLMEVLQSGAELQFHFNNDYIQQQTIRVIKGAEWNYLTHASQQQLFQSLFSITPQSSRMGIRLKGAAITARQPCDIISSPVTEGTVQLTSSGELIILMADAQTVGGYPRILQVAAMDLRALAQKKPGDSIQFQLVSLQEAEEALLQQHAAIKQAQQLIENLKQRGSPNDAHV